MPGGKKFAVVLSVLVTGASAAFFFRKDASPVDFRQEASADPFRQRIERRVVADTTWTRSLVTARSKTSSRPQQALRVPTATVAVPQGLSGQNQPTFQKSFNPVGALLEPLEGVPSSDVDERDSLELSGEQGASLGVPLATHRIVDGDTLSKLADEFLGRADRYLEIFELNRDVLANPDLLPIGTLLKLPPRQRPAPADRSPADPLQPTNSQLEAPLNLVPVPGSGRDSS
jgi:LysM repeat protein